MPLRQRTISYSVKEPKNKPGPPCKQKGNQINPACLLPYPSCQVKQCQYSMKYQKKQICSFQPKHNMLLKFLNQDIKLRNCKQKPLCKQLTPPKQKTTNQHLTIKNPHFY